MNNYETIIKTIGNKVKYYRSINNISLSALAKEADISKSTLFGLEEGRSNPTISTLLNIAKSLNISIDELINSKDKDINSNLSLINKDEKTKSKLYKLTLKPMQIINLNLPQNSYIEIEPISGEIFNISDRIIIKQTSQIKPDAILQSLDNESTALIKVKRYDNEFLIENDIFINQPNEKIIYHLAKKNIYGNIITRVIFPFIYPLELSKKIPYMQILETQSNRPVYYIYSILKGLLNGIQKSNVNFNKEDIDFVRQLIYDENISTSLINKDFNSIYDCVIKHYQNLGYSYISSEDIINSNENKILIFEEFINCNNSLNEIKKLNISIIIYRALEMFYPLNEDKLNNYELEIYSSIKNILPKSLYLAINGYDILALEEIKKLKNIPYEEMYSNLINYINKNLDNISKYYFFNNKTLFENCIQDLGYKITKKLNFHPSINNSGKYLYLLEK